jgi:hypothetical protein
MSLKEKDLASTTSDLDALWRSVDKARSTSKTVTVDKAQLTAILLDHSKLAQEIWGKPTRIGGQLGCN